MKINTFKKLAVSTMAVAMGAALVGSISGSIAWYQYSTRSTVSYSGASAHCTESLQVRLYEDAVAAVATKSTDTSVDANKTYYTRASSSAGEGHLNDGTYAYTKVVTPTGDPSTSDYYELSNEGSDAVGNKTWASDLRLADVQSYLATVRGSADYALRPVTSGALAANSVAATLYKSPIYQYENQASWKTATEADYVRLPLQFRVVDVDGSRTAGDFDTFLAKKVYISKLEMSADAAANTANGKEDISAALRVGFDGGTDVTFSTTGADVNTFGQLDLNNDGVYDLITAHEFDLDGIAATQATLPTAASHNGEHYGARDTHLVYESNGTGWAAVASNWYCSYGGASGVAESSVASTAVANDADPYNIVENDGLIGTTNADGSALKIDVLIYLEGWQELGATPSAMWADEDYVGSAFKVNMRFAVTGHAENE